MQIDPTKVIRRVSGPEQVRYYTYCAVGYWCIRSYPAQEYFQCMSNNFKSSWRPSLIGEDETVNDVEWTRCPDTFLLLKGVT